MKVLFKRIIDLDFSFNTKSELSLTKLFFKITVVSKDVNKYVEFKFNTRFVSRFKYFETLKYVLNLFEFFIIVLLIIVRF